MSVHRREMQKCRAERIQSGLVAVSRRFLKEKLRWHKGAVTSMRGGAVARWYGGSEARRRVGVRARRCKGAQGRSYAGGKMCKLPGVVLQKGGGSRLDWANSRICEGT